jgi:hypothetical protein
LPSTALKTIPKIGNAKHRKVIMIRIKLIKTGVLETLSFN